MEEFKNNIEQPEKVSGGEIQGETEPKVQESNKKLAKAEGKVLEDLLLEELKDVEYSFHPGRELPKGVKGRSIFEALGEKRSKSLIDYLFSDQEFAVLFNKNDEGSKERRKFLAQKAALEMKTGKLDEEIEKAA